MEQYELGSQLRRSSKSVVVNLAEGMGRQGSHLEVKRYVKMAIGSCDESRVWLEYAKDLGYIEEKVYEYFEDKYREIGKMLRGITKRCDEKIENEKN